MNQRVDLDNLQAVEVHDLGSWLYSRAKLEEMNWKFVRAMAAAIRGGLERPPRIGIDKTPGTKNASYFRMPPQDPT